MGWVRMGRKEEWQKGIGASVKVAEGGIVKEKGGMKEGGWKLI